MPVNVICKCVTVLTRIKRYVVDFNKLRFLFKTFFDSKFNYCPLTWMFYCRTTNNKMNKLDERALRLVYDDYLSKFEKLLEKTIRSLFFITTYRHSV